MNPSHEIRERLRAYPELQTVEDDGWFTVCARGPDGFDVSLQDNGEELTVYFSGWHRHFDRTAVEEALACFLFGLSDRCRIKVFSRGGRDYKWVLESRGSDGWTEDSTIRGLFCAPFWRRSEVRHLQNRRLECSES